MYARNVATLIIVKVTFLFPIAVPDVSMTRVQQLAPCSTSVNFLSNSHFILPSKLALRRKVCLHWNYPKNMDCIKRLVGSLNGKFNKLCKVQQAHPLTGEVHVDEFYIGGEEEGIIGRKTGKKKLVVVAIEIK